MSIHPSPLVPSARTPNGADTRPPGELQFAEHADSTPTAVSHAFSLAVSTGLGDHATLTRLVQGDPISPTDVGPGPGVHAEALQTRCGEGPGLTAAMTGTTQAVPFIATDLRWPRWTAVAGGTGVGAVLAVPFRSLHVRGALCLWSRAPRRYEAEDEQRAQDLAALVVGILEATALQAQLKRGLEGRTVIGQAQGILIERHRLTPAAAFTVLSGYSQQCNRKVLHLAEELVSTGELSYLDRHLPPVPPTGGAGPPVLPRHPPLHLVDAHPGVVVTGPVD